MVTEEEEVGLYELNLKDIVNLVFKELVSSKQRGLHALKEASTEIILLSSKLVKEESIAIAEEEVTSFALWCLNVNDECCKIWDSPPLCDNESASVRREPNPKHARVASSNIKSQLVGMNDGVHEIDVAPPAFDGTMSIKSSFLLDESGTEEDQSAFMKELYHFFLERNMEFKPPTLYGEGLNCLKLWRAVTRLGGYDKVTRCKLWLQEEESFKPPNSIFNARQAASPSDASSQAFEGSTLAFGASSASLLGPSTSGKKYFGFLTHVKRLVNFSSGFPNKRCMTLLGISLASLNSAEAAQSIRVGYDVWQYSLLLVAFLVFMEDSKIIYHKLGAIFRSTMHGCVRESHAWVKSVLFSPESFNEVQLLSTLLLAPHPNILRLHHLAEENGKCYSLVDKWDCTLKELIDFWRGSENPEHV
ncbi:unnamed protein product [Cochlearia groenlandica]